MKSEILDAYCLALGISDQQLADLFDVSKRTARRWRSTVEVPEDVSAAMQYRWDMTVDQIRRNLREGTGSRKEADEDKKASALALLVKDVCATRQTQEPLDPFTFADTLDARRLALGVSVKEFAELIGVSTPTASRWLNGAVSGKGPYLMAEAEVKLREAEDWIEAQIGGVDLVDAKRWPLGMRKVAEVRKQTARRNFSRAWI